MKFTVGVDEVGRGPLAGPVSVGVVVSGISDLAKEFDILKDSKLMSPAAREKVFQKALELREESALAFGIFSTSASDIDRWGIEAAISGAVARGLAKLCPNPEAVSVFLDGRLKAPEVYSQETIVRGDETVPVISLAAIVAKVSRDRYMSEVVHEQFPEYGFNSHKGYGTAAHISAVKQYGPCAEHRRSFISNILPLPISRVQ